MQTPIQRFRSCLRTKPVGDSRHRFPVLKAIAPCLIGVLLVAAMPGRAIAHRSSVVAADGLPIPSLTHDQLAVVAEYRQAVLRVADRQSRRDETLIRLRNFVDIQRMACLWGMVPDSLTDEDSPFNECSHAYLSGTMALLLHLRDREGASGHGSEEASQLLNRVALAMLAKETAPMLCAYSGAPFNTADVIAPHWIDVPFHPTSLLSLSGVAVLLAAAVGGLWKGMARIGAGSTAR